MLLVAGLVLGERFAVSSWSGRSLLGLLYLIGPGSVLAYASFVWLVTRTQPSIATTYTYVTRPVVAVFLGWLILDEPITVAVVVGAILIVGGVAALLVGENRGDATRREREADESSERRVSPP